MKIIYYLPTYLLEWKVLLTAIWSMNWYVVIKSDFSFKSANLTTFPTPFLQIRNDDMNDHRKFPLFITSSNYMIRKTFSSSKSVLALTVILDFLFFIVHPKQDPIDSSNWLDNHEKLTKMCWFNFFCKLELDSYRKHYSF